MRGHRSPESDKEKSITGGCRKYNIIPAPNITCYTVYAHMLFQ